jgi:hypothetical protein
MNNKSRHSENPILGFLNRMVGLYWILFFLAVPVVVISSLIVAYSRRWHAKDKTEKRFWTDEIRLDWVMLYFTSFIYLTITQDLWLVPFDDKAAVADVFKYLYGISGYLWCRIFTGDLDSDNCLVVSLGIGFAVLCYYMFKIHMWKPNGSRDSAWNWRPSPRRMAAIRQQYNNEEAQYNILAAQKRIHDMNHPENEPDWKELSKPMKELRMREWREKAAVIRSEMNICPRSKVFEK